MDSGNSKKMKKQEISHGRKIMDDAERVWGWGTPAGSFRVKRRIKEILKRVNNPNNSKVLEIGCGTGIFTEQFLKEGINLVSLDISHDLTKLARSKRSIKKILVSDAEVLPFCDESFDCVIGVSILHHLINFKQALQEIKRVLKKQGKIIFSEPNLANPQIFLQKRISWLKTFMQDTPSERAFLRCQLKSNLWKAGFRQIEVVPFEFLHPYTPKNLIEPLNKIQYFLEQIPVLKEISGSLLIYAQK